MKLTAAGVRSELADKVESISTQKMLACYQCGKCSAGCPVVSAMDLPPHMVMRLVQLGAWDEVLESKAIWLCASCHTCVSRCPKSVDLSRIMEALRLVLLRRDFRGFDPATLAEGLICRLPQQALVGIMRKAT